MAPIIQVSDETLRTLNPEVYYEYVVSVIHLEISNWGTSSKVVRHWKENPYFMRRITAHELILSHYFEIHKRHYKDEGLKDGQIRALFRNCSFCFDFFNKKC